MIELEKLQYMYRFKRVPRATFVGDRKESDAEHVYSCLMLARHFLPLTDPRPDDLRVMNLILYHDLVEIETGDVNVLDVAGRVGKHERELQGLERLMTKVPAALGSEIRECWLEFEANETREAKFAHAMDHLDPLIHSLENGTDFVKEGFTTEWLRKKKTPYFAPFPAVLRVFEEAVLYGTEKGFLGKEYDADR